LLWRGFRKRCPQCGEGALFLRRNQLHESCAVCGLKYLENEGDLWGYLVFVDRGLFILPLIGMIYFRSYFPNWIWLLVLGFILVIGMIYTLPRRTGMSLAIDYLIRRKSGNLP
jgi:uncharacterized protein (DUF983 family)